MLIALGLDMTTSIIMLTWIDHDSHTLGIALHYYSYCYNNSLVFDMDSHVNSIVLYISYGKN